MIRPSHFSCMPHHYLLRTLEAHFKKKCVGVAKRTQAPKASTKNHAGLLCDCNKETHTLRLWTAELSTSRGVEKGPCPGTSLESRFRLRQAHRAGAPAKRSCQVLASYLKQRRNRASQIILHRECTQKFPPSDLEGYLGSQNMCSGMSV